MTDHLEMRETLGALLHEARAHATEARAKGDTNRHFAAGLLRDALLFTNPEDMDPTLVDLIENSMHLLTAGSVPKAALTHLRRSLIAAGASLTPREG